jgi:hypothetical protein
VVGSEVQEQAERGPPAAAGRSRRRELRQESTAEHRLQPVVPRRDRLQPAACSFFSSLRRGRKGILNCFYFTAGPPAAARPSRSDRATCPIRRPAALLTGRSRRFHPPGLSDRPQPVARSQVPLSSFLFFGFSPLFSPSHFSFTFFSSLFPALLIFYSSDFSPLFSTLHFSFTFVFPRYFLLF